MRIVLLTFTLLCAIGLVLRTAPPTSADTTPAVPDPATYKSLYAEKCSACHNLYDPEAQAMNRQQWQRTVNRMLVKYKASDEINPTEAAHIVDYLSTFAPKTAALVTGPNGRRRAGQFTLDTSQTDAGDVWPGEPVQSRTVTFEGPSALSGLLANPSTAAAKTAAWHVVGTDATPNGKYVKVGPAGSTPAAFALLLDPKSAARDVDVRVRFQIVAGKTGPSVGIAFGASGGASAQYSLLRCDAQTGTLSLGTAPPTPNSGGAGKGLASGWHTLRLVARNGFVRGWLDNTKQVSATDASYTGGQIGLWTGGDTIAAFDNWTTDTYSVP